MIFWYNIPMEKWKDINGYEGRYQVSNLGRIKSLPRNGTIKEERILKYEKNNQGYLQVCLYNSGKKKLYLVHRIVAIAFIPNPENKPEVNHKWGIKTDNRASELEWNTQSENTLHAYENKLQKIKTGKEHKGSRVILQYDLESNYIKKWDTIKEAEEELKIYGISKCCRGQRKTAGGYIWKYKDTE